MPSTSEPAGAEAAAAIEEAARERERARERVAEDGEATLRTLESRVRDLRDLLDRYEDRATGSGDFKAFIEFQEEIAHFTEDLPEDLPERDTFEALDDHLQQRRLTESDYERAREMVDEAAAALAPLEALETAREEYDAARAEARSRLETVRDRIDDLERLERLGEADLDAPVERLRDPIAAYDEAVAEAFETFRREAPVRELFDVLHTARLYPLVDLPTPDEELYAFVRDRPVGDEPLSHLLELADYSRSKLDHYVDEPATLKRVVGGQRTALDRLSADPLQVGWPPPSADALPWYCRERRAVVVGFAPALTGELRQVRRLADREDYSRLRESAVARDRLDDTQRERVASGAVSEELAALREERERIEAALDAHPPR